MTVGGQGEGTRTLGNKWLPCSTCVQLLKSLIVVRSVLCYIVLREVSEKMKRSQEPRMPDEASWRVVSTPQSLGARNTLGSDSAAGRITPDISVMDSVDEIFVHDA